MRPPISGPTSVPTICAVDIQPIARPSDSSGTCDPTSAVAALANPLSIPIIVRAPASSQTFWESPIKAEVMQPNMLERTTIGLRPTRSARPPQIGAKNAATKKLIEPMIPDHKLTSATERIPSCAMKSGMNGSEKPNEAALIALIPTIAHKVRRQRTSRGFDAYRGRAGLFAQGHRLSIMKGAARVAASRFVVALLSLRGFPMPARTGGRYRRNLRDAEARRFRHGAERLVEGEPESGGRRLIGRGRRRRRYPVVLLELRRSRGRCRRRDRGGGRDQRFGFRRLSRNPLHRLRFRVVRRRTRSFGRGRERRPGVEVREDRGLAFGQFPGGGADDDVPGLRQELRRRLLGDRAELFHVFFRSFFDLHRVEQKIDRVLEVLARRDLGEGEDRLGALGLHHRDELLPIVERLVVLEEAELAFGARVQHRDPPPE